MLKMDFENLDIKLKDLPDFKTVELNSIQKRYKKLLWLNTAALFVILYALPVVGFFINGIPRWISICVIGLVSVIFIFRVIELEKGFPIKKFGIRQYDMIYQSGFFHYTETVVPYNRIQHVEIKQGPLSRLFSLYSLRLYTAGASSGDLIIDGLDKSTAQKLKAKVLDKTTEVDVTD